MPIKKPKIRNPVAMSPLLRKGGIHIKSKTGQRVRARLSTRSVLDEWLDEREDYLNYQQNKGSESSLYFVTESNAQSYAESIFSFTPRLA